MVGSEKSSKLAKLKAFTEKIQFTPSQKPISTGTIDLKELNQRSRCRLLELPPELRHRIWELTLAREASQHITFEPFRKIVRYDRPSIMSCNRQIRTETEPIYAKSTSILLTTAHSFEWPRIKKWLLQSHQRELYKIIRLEINFYTYWRSDLRISGFFGETPVCDMPNSDHLRSGWSDPERDVVQEVVSRAETIACQILARTKNRGFGIDEFAAFGDIFVAEYG